MNSGFQAMFGVQIFHFCNLVFIETDFIIIIDNFSYLLVIIITVIEFIDDFRVLPLNFYFPYLNLYFLI